MPRPYARHRAPWETYVRHIPDLRRAAVPEQDRRRPAQRVLRRTPPLPPPPVAHLSPLSPDRGHPQPARPRGRPPRDAAARRARRPRRRTPGAAPLYEASAHLYPGPALAPVLHDNWTGTVVSTHAPDIVRDLARRFGGHGDCLLPRESDEAFAAVERLCEQGVNATAQRAGLHGGDRAERDTALATLLRALDLLELRLASQEYVLGDDLTLADVRLWVTLVQLDTVHRHHLDASAVHRITEHPGCGPTPGGSPRTPPSARTSTWTASPAGTTPTAGARRRRARRCRSWTGRRTSTGGRRNRPAAPSDAGRGGVRQAARRSPDFRPEHRCRLLRRTGLRAGRGAAPS